jgi:hypothetical protein
VQNVAFVSALRAVAGQRRHAVVLKRGATVHLTCLMYTTGHQGWHKAVDIQGPTRSCQAR